MTVKHVICFSGVAIFGFRGRGEISTPGMCREIFFVWGGFLCLGGLLPEDFLVWGPGAWVAGDFLCLGRLLLGDFLV